MRNTLIVLAMTTGLTLTGAGLGNAADSQPLNQRCAEARTAYTQLVASYPILRRYLETTRLEVNARCGVDYIPATTVITPTPVPAP